jgi:hypothetical protein
LFGREPPEPAFKLVSVGDRDKLVGRCRSIDRQNPKVRHALPLSARVTDADVDQDPLKPGVEPVRIAEASQVTPGDHQRVLKGILGPIDVTEDPVRDREQAIGARTYQVDECLPVVALGRLHEFAIHWLGLSVAPRGDAFQLYWYACPGHRSLAAVVLPPGRRDAGAVAGSPRVDTARRRDYDPSNALALWQGEC